MRLMKQSTQLLRVFDAWRQFEWILGLLSLISSCVTISIVPFIRKDFGERYFGWINLFFGYTIVANFTFLGNVIGMAGGRRFSSLMLLFWLAFIAASLYHRWQISRKNKARVEWHSMCHGVSLLPLPFTEETTLKVCEPVLVFLAGLLVWKISGQVGVWLMIGGVSLLVNNHLVYYFQRQSILDMRDAGIEAKYASGALAGKPARETGGFVVAASNIQMIRQDAGLQKAFANLSPDVKDLFDSGPDFNDGDVAA